MDEKRHFPTQALAHFLKFMNATPENPSVLFLNNHVSHLSIDAVVPARKKEVHMITFPPKCSHKTQPLCIAVYDPSKRVLCFILQSSVNIASKEYNFKL